MRVAFPESESQLAALVGEFGDSDGRLAASLDGETLVCVRDSDALVANVGSPKVTFGIDEPRMAAAVWDYLENLPRSMVYRDDAARCFIAGWYPGGASDADE